MFDPNELDQSLWPTPSGGGDAPFQGAPPPPPEVSVRTLESDLHSMVNAGGGPPVVQGVSVPKPRVIAGDTIKPDVSYDMIWVSLGLIVAGTLLGLGYYFFIYQGAPVTPGGYPTSPTSSVNVVPSTNFVHRSFFLAPPDATVTFVEGAAAANAAELQSYSQRITSLLSPSTTNGFFFEVAMQQSGGKAMSFNYFLTFVNAPILDANFLKNNFNEDFTYFVYRDSSGYFPGYILQLKPGKDARLLYDDTAKLESSSQIQNLFLSFSGSSLGGFSSGLVGNESVRTQQFSNATFLYGWFQDKYLIISTSHSGFTEAVSRL